MTEQIVIQKLVPSDVEGAHQVFEASITRAFAQEGLGSLQDDIRHEIEQKKELLQAALQQWNVPEANVFFLLAKHEGRVVGTISYGPCGEEIRICTDQRITEMGELGSLYILPEFQGRGIASKLIRALASELDRQGIRQFCLDSGYGIAQQKWRRKFGEPYAVAEDFWGEGVHHMVWLCNVQDYAVK
ncbi:GNAT family N-acetyltransferase [Paenibacillus sp. JJ-223]|uniref:GNAT family N-acetyltransferase n=1 Tax=Paenibacillus sp. JJ-223 TaxID=2905647 RepID=UPI001F22099E|nr:GNAT family N-acetyltransferase [Paenibacillus sp. JJ-223]CAH1207314.1 hypothetical protein PAECIP111890_02972 [Paenibacillus sp. JJ-223]